MVSREFLATRHQNIAGIESVTLTVLTSGATVTGVTAERRNVNRRTGGQADLSSDELQFILHSLTLGSTLPKAGDTITDSSSVVYRIESVVSELLATRHRCTVVKNR